MAMRRVDDFRVRVDELTLRCDSDVIVRGLPAYGETFSASRREVIDRILVN